MTTNRPSRPARTRSWTELARAAWGAALLARPHELLRHVHHVAVDHRSIVVARALGARHLAQAALSGLRPRPEVLAVGVLVDAVHASTALGLAAVDRNRARAGLLDAAIAAAWSAAGMRDLMRNAACSPERRSRGGGSARPASSRAGRPEAAHAVLRRIVAHRGSRSA
ncbi:MAG TPA: hypothetical protein VE442_19925 [Jatrophihabitans sp.]|nr:hypothetical protein [Jatrophihabitans sp.]